MLEGLDTIDWTSLTHTHGAATNVPGLLRSLLSEDGNVRQEAIADLHEMIWHQGSMYPASAEVIPFLYELLTHPDVQDKGGIVSLLGSMATGEGDWERNVRNDGEEMWRRILAKQGKSLEQKLAEDAAAMKAIHCAVSLGLRHLLPYLSDREGLAPLVAETLGKYPEHATWLVPAIDAALDSESDEFIRAALAKSKARLTNSGSGPTARAAEPGR